MQKKDLFDIKETVNRNIQKFQTPNFGQHKSLIGWCSMNYPKVLLNPLYMPKPQPKKHLHDLQHFYQHPKGGVSPSQFTKPFTGKNQKQRPTSLTLATTPYQFRSEIFQKANQVVNQFSNVKPLACMLGPDKDRKFQRKIRQIGQITYNPPYESQQMRHLKRLPNSVLTQQNLMQIMSPQLKQLNLQNNYWITNDLMNKIGYFAINIQKLDISYTQVTDNTLVQLGKSCQKLKSITISNTKNLTSKGIRKFLQSSSKLIQFKCTHNWYVDQFALQPLPSLIGLQSIHLDFTKVTNKILQQIAQKDYKFRQISLSNCPLIKAQPLIKILDKSYSKLQYIDLSLNARDDFNNALMIKVGSCPNLNTIILTGITHLTDQGVYNLISGQRKQGKVSKPQGFKKLKTIKLGGCVGLSDAVFNIFKHAQDLRFIQLNNLQKLTDNFLQHAKTQPKLQIVLLNFTPNITQQKLQQIRASYSHIKWVRNIIKVTDPKDDGLRMPYPPASLKKKKTKAKKK